MSARLVLTRTGAAGRAVFRGLATLHIGLLLIQPVLAGMFLSGEYGALEAHRSVGGVVVFAALLQVLGAVAYRWPGGGSAWPIAAAAALLGLEIVQITVGYSRSFGLHLPLGVALCAGGIALTWWAWLPVRAPGGAR